MKHIVRLSGVYDLTFLVKFMMTPCHPPQKKERLGISDKFFVLASDAIQMVVMEIVTWVVRSLSSGAWTQAVFIYKKIYIYTYIN